MKESMREQNAMQHNISKKYSILADIGKLPLHQWFFVDLVKRHHRRFNKRKTVVYTTAEASIIGDEFDFMMFMQKHPTYVFVRKKRLYDVTIDGYGSYVQYRFNPAFGWESSNEQCRMTKTVEDEYNEWWYANNDEYYNKLDYDDGKDNIRNMSKAMSKAAWKK